MDSRSTDRKGPSHPRSTLVVLTLGLVALLWLASLGGSWAMPASGPLLEPTATGVVGQGSTVTIPPVYTYLPLVIWRIWCDRFEPNDTFTTAYGPLASATVYEAKLCYGDNDDLYYFDLTTLHTIVIDLTNIPAHTDYDLSLWSATRTLLKASRHAGNANEHIQYTPTRTGRYYVRVHPYYGRSDTQPYSLVVTYE